MKKVFLAMITLFVIGISSASAQIVWGARVGLSRPTVTASGYGESESLNGKFGLEVGPTLYYSLQNNFYINSGAMFSMKTFGMDGYGDNLDLFYLDIPVYAGYRFIVENVSLYAQAGPYAGFKLTESFPGDFETSGLNSFNAGLGVMAGINLNKFKVEAGYQAGLVNVLDMDYSEDGYKMTLGSLFVGVSYVF